MNAIKEKVTASDKYELIKKELKKKCKNFTVRQARNDNKNGLKLQIKGEFFICLIFERKVFADGTQVVAWYKKNPIDNGLFFKADIKLSFPESKQELDFLIDRLKWMEKGGEK
jgi:hypothetical protein